MKKLFVTSDGEKYSVAVTTYANNKLALAITLTNEEEECSHVLTVNLGKYYRDDTFIPMGSSFIDVNAFWYGDEEIVKFLDEISTPHTVFGTEAVKVSGFVEYPLRDFNLEALAEYDKDGVEEYKKDYKEALIAERKKITERSSMGWVKMTEGLEEELVMHKVLTKAICS